MAAFPSAASGLLPGATRELRNRRPDAELTLQVLEDGPAVDALLAGRVDVATVVQSALQPIKPRPGVDYLPICDDELRVAVASDHPLATRASVALEELSEEPFLITEMGGTCADSNVVLHAFRDAGFEPNVRFSFDDYQALQGMAASGAGVALIPTIALASSRSDVVVLPLRGRAPSRQILAAVRTGERDPLVEHFVEALRRSARARCRLAYAGRGRVSLRSSSAAISSSGRSPSTSTSTVAVVLHQRLRVLRVLAQALLDRLRRVVLATAGQQPALDLSSPTLRKTTASKSRPDAWESLRG